MKKLLTLVFTAVLATTAQATIFYTTGEVADDGRKLTTAESGSVRIVYKENFVTEIDGEKHSLLPPIKSTEAKKTLQMLKETMEENNRLTEAYLKTNSPEWKKLNTEEMKANTKKFNNIWKRIIIDRHYNKEVLDTYEKYMAKNLANWDKMYAHFYSLSTNEPFKEKVKDSQRADKNHFLNDKAAIRYLGTLL